MLLIFSIFQALNEGLSLLFSPPKIAWNIGDSAVKASTSHKGEVLAINQNLLQIRWEGGEVKWEPAGSLEKKSLSQMISSKLAVTSCSVELAVGEFCAACYNFKDAKSWYRAVVVNAMRRKKKVFKYMVLFVDYGNVEECDVKAVRPLPTQFLQLPAQAIPCYLPEIQAKPADTSIVVSSDFEEYEDVEDDSPFRGQYTREAATAFRNLVLEERVYLSVEGEGVPLHYGYRKELEDTDTLLQFRNSTLPVSIADRVSGDLVNLAEEFIKQGLHADRIFTMNYSMYEDPVDPEVLEEKMSRIRSQMDTLEEGRASPLDFLQPNSELSSDVDSETLSSFDPMSEDFKSDSNLVDHDRDDVGAAVYGQTLSKRTLCRFFSRGRVCYKGRDCRYLHQKKSDFHSEAAEQAMVVDNKPPSPTNDMPIIALVTSVISPFHFWAQILPHDINPSAIGADCEVADPLTELTRKMCSVYRFRGYRECKYYAAIGEVVAVQSKVADGDFRRARVTETDYVGEGMCRVFHLDYGIFEVVHEKALRVMDPSFIKELPFQAQEMFLADVRPAYRTDREPVFVGDKEVPLDDAESKQARQFFLDCVTNKSLIAKVIEKTREGALCVHLWDCSETTWTSINKGLVDRGFADSVHPLPEELTTDCGTLASSSYSNF